MRDVISLAEQMIRLGLDQVKKSNADQPGQLSVEINIPPREWLTAVVLTNSARIA